MENQQVYFSGRPTAPDVDLILKKFPVSLLVHGFTMTYSDIAETIKEKENSHRMKTVCICWRKKLFREKNIYLDTIANVGFIVADPSQRVSKSASGMNAGYKKIRSMSTLALQTDETALSEDEKRTRNYAINVGGMMRTMLAVEKKKLVYKLTNESEKELKTG